MGSDLYMIIHVNTSMSFNINGIQSTEYAAFGATNCGNATPDPVIATLATNPYELLLITLNTLRVAVSSKGTEGKDAGAESDMQASRGLYACASTHFPSLSSILSLRYLLVSSIPRRGHTPLAALQLLSQLRALMTSIMRYKQLNAANHSNKY